MRPVQDAVKSQFMALSVTNLRALIDPMMSGPHSLSQNEVARKIGIEPSALSRWLQGGGASYPLVAQVAEALGVPVSQLWNGKVPRRWATQDVPRGTHTPTGRVSETSGRYVVGKRRDALWAIEQMSLALADIARRARLGEED